MAALPEASDGQGPPAATQPATRFERVRAPRGGRRLHLRVVDRPTTRGDCAGVHRPCHFVSCAHNLMLDVLEPTDGAPYGTIKFNYLHPADMPADASCALDVADRGEHTLEEIASVMRISDEWVRQLGWAAIAKCEQRGGEDLRDAAEADERTEDPEMAAKKAKALNPAEPTKERANMAPSTLNGAARPVREEPTDDAKEAAPTKEPRARPRARRASPEGPPEVARATAREEPADDTASLVADVERARARLRERRDKLRAELAAADRALSVDDGAPAEALAPASSAPREAARRGPRPASTRAPTPPASSKTKVARALEYIREHPGATTAQVAAGIGEASSAASGALWQLKANSRAEKRGQEWHPSP